MERGALVSEFLYSFPEAFRVALKNINFKGISWGWFLTEIQPSHRNWKVYKRIGIEMYIILNVKYFLDIIIYYHFKWKLVVIWKDMSSKSPKSSQQQNGRGTTKGEKEKFNYNSLALIREQENGWEKMKGERSKSAFGPTFLFVP